MGWPGRGAGLSGLRSLQFASLLDHSESFGNGDMEFTQRPATQHPRADTYIHLQGLEVWARNVIPPVYTAVSLVLPLSLSLYYESCMHEGNILSSFCHRCRNPHASRTSFRAAKNRHCNVRPIHISCFIVLGESHQPKVALLWELQTVPWATESH